MTDLEILVGLNCIDLGYRRFKRLLEHFGSLQKIIQASGDELRRTEGIGEKLASSITSIKNQDLEKEFEAVRKLNLKIITINDRNYPQNLKEIYDPPILLYVKGDFAPQDERGIAIVGSRRASFYGLNCAERFAFELAGFGFTIISGMARGVDTAAHKGALKQKGRTIAVMGSGFEHIYPPENKELVEKISQNGAVISEFPLAVLPHPHNFPRRNRIISGLSRGVLVIEAARNSGALITADFALEQGREVFSLPGEIDSVNSCGTNFLIKQGAKLVSCVEDIIEELNIDFRNIAEGISPRKEEDKISESKDRELDKEEKMVYRNLSRQPLTVDEICDVCNEDVSKIMAVLSRLQLKRMVQQLPGKRFVRIK
ncbi:MAG: DNA-processing protein DprA [Candidatus Omnitrophica bacterium]|nr:DNA-processing protein DprA [Candidatus Omnitrophota bacterium]